MKFQQYPANKPCKSHNQCEKDMKHLEYRPLLQIRKYGDAHKKEEGHFVYPPYANRKFLIAET